MPTVRKLLEKINIAERFEGTLRFDEPMAPHTSFRVGGPADAWFRPTGSRADEAIAEVMRRAKEEEIPVFVLGGGANVVIADKGVRGVVVDTSGWAGCEFREDADGGPVVSVRSGTSLDAVADACAAVSLGGLSFLAGMPGSFGGAVWMNARCYGKSISDVLIEVVILDEDLRRSVIPFRTEDFSYKRSPFQGRDVFISSARARLSPCPQEDLRVEMEKLRADRESKGHYRLPSAGSSFKNNHAFGKPTGQIVDELGLRGLQIGGARVADWHGNIIVNTGTATARDIRALADEVSARVFAATGYVLESEMLFVGDWE